MSYRALKRQFAVDDAFLADLTDELVEIQQIATDQDGRMLVWAGQPIFYGIVSSDIIWQFDKLVQQVFARNRRSSSGADDPHQQNPHLQETSDARIRFASGFN